MLGLTSVMQRIRFCLRACAYAKTAAAPFACRMRGSHPGLTTCFFAAFLSPLLRSSSSITVCYLVRTFRLRRSTTAPKPASFAIFPLPTHSNASSTPASVPYFGTPAVTSAHRHSITTALLPFQLTQALSISCKRVCFVPQALCAFVSCW
ncbi:hypothetical protein LDBPK_352070 [Leishmania donovani]|uniref:Uncharacterized protein n=1 Tax=Leishmania donovani TaxID=5661 RepID=E9BS79_LEIDO|nr:hypothetical protein LDBPK_352070 [Leishmania donovani]AYU83009.1 hypothetical protein LdCL_350025900 [Leishmania donovani]CBZ38108.1 hypothetical protein LDBPK_352070 [Leishmania donovani]